jgi:hypothetical protein
MFDTRGLQSATMFAIRAQILRAACHQRSARRHWPCAPEVALPVITSVEEFEVGQLGTKNHRPSGGGGCSAIESWLQRPPSFPPVAV